jgi:UDP-N-acetylmuramoyl-tripeptide--D-alanyl-D-alanine ligase
MIPLALDEVQALAPGTLERRPGADEITGVQIDSRLVEPGDLFVALGRGVEYLVEARSRGAGATLVPEDAFGALGELGRAVRGRSRARVAAVTGSVGKTTTKDIIGALASPHAATVVAAGSHNNEIGLPLTLCRIEPETEVVVVEMGMRGLGQIAALAAIARPDVGIVTSVAPVHLELLETVERVAQAKAEVIGALPAGGAAVVPAGEALLDPYLRSDVETVRFGPGGDVRLLSLQVLPGGSGLEIEAFGERVELELPFRGRHNALNALAALGAYGALGLPLADAQRGAHDARLSHWRGEESPLPGDGLVINDAYNANPIAMAAALDYLCERAGERRKVVVLGDMAELGPGAPGYHAEVGAAAAQAGVEAIVAIGPLAHGYLEGGSRIPIARWAPDAEAGLGALRELLEPGDCVLVKGSRSMGLEAVAEALTVVAAAHS